MKIKFFTVLITGLFSIFCSPVFGDSSVVSLDGTWKLRHDPDNVGKNQNWWEFSDDKDGNVDVSVPGIAQLAMPGKRGVFWYYRSFDAPKNPHPQGRYVLRFWQADYFAEVWLNGKRLGSHEGGEAPFEFDVTRSILPDAANRIVVRIINPVDYPIDGFLLKEIPHRNRTVNIEPGSDVSMGGLTDCVELLVVPAIRVKDIFVRPDAKTGEIAIQTTLEGPVEPKLYAGKNVAISIDVAPSHGGETLLHHETTITYSPNNAVIETTVKLNEFRLWDIDDPYMYRVSVRSQTKGERGFSEQSTRTGFRDFRFENGAFRLNGRRIFLKCTHSGAVAPMTSGGVPLNAEMIRKDLYIHKTMGLNTIRYIAGMPQRLLLEQCDENGMLVYNECRAAWCMSPSEQLERRFIDANREMVLRDRNHPSIVIWGVINEMTEPRVLNVGLQTLPIIRELDPTRLVLYHSGAWDVFLGDKWNPLEACSSFGRVANPGSTVWENTMFDWHPYQDLPHSDDVLRELRFQQKDRVRYPQMDGLPMFISEYGMGSAIDLFRITRQYEQWGGSHTEDAKLYRDYLALFMRDWERWKLEDTFIDPADYFRQTIEWMAAMRLLGINAIRANPALIGHSVTGAIDHGFSGEGLITWFRELKQGSTDAMADAFAPLRFCLFADQWQVYRGTTVRFEAVLANEDVLKPGAYKVRIQIAAPNNRRVFDEIVPLTIPEIIDGKEPSFAIPFFDKSIVIDGPSGVYRFHATMLEGGAPAGRPLEFFVTDTKDMPAVNTTVVLWGDDPELAEWLASHGIATKKFAAATNTDVILVGRKSAEDFAPLLKRLESGARVIFLCPEVFREGDDKTAHVPLETKGQLRNADFWLYHKDDWTKNHPYFDGLPRGGIMEHAFYRNLLTKQIWSGQSDPEEIAAGAINTSLRYDSGLSTAVYRYGKGRFVLNTLRIRDNLGNDPIAERILRNMINHEARVSRCN